MHTGMWLSAAVIISAMSMAKDPSPVTRMEGLPVASATPFAAPRPKPIVPRPPEVMNVLGFVKRRYCAAHIWC